MYMFGRLNTLIYGDEINIAMRLDELLRAAASDGGIEYQHMCNGMMTHSQREHWQRICHLRREGLISEDMELHVFRITIDGQNFLASGGYTAEAKKSKNEVFAFRISLAAIAISLISLVVTVADRLSRP